MAKYGNKGDIPVLVNPLSKEQKFINPTELLIYIGTIIQQENVASPENVKIITIT